jgi:hypothetical protein
MFVVSLRCSCPAFDENKAQKSPLVRRQKRARAEKRQRLFAVLTIGQGRRFALAVWGLRR